MAAKIGTGNVLFRVGSGSPSKVFLGTVAVQDVPGAPTWDGTPPASGNDTFAQPFLAPADDGGSEITGYNFYVNDDLDSAENAGAVLVDVTFVAPGTYEIAVAAVNAIGEGPRLTATYEYVED
jgi:hypothetical protein